MSDLKELGVDLSQFENLRRVSIEEVFPSFNYAQINRIVEESQRPGIEAMQEVVEERKRNEQEKRDSLRRIAENSEDTVKSLKEINELLSENNALLKRENEKLLNQLNDVKVLIGNLFDMEDIKGEEHKILMQQAIELASKIDASIIANGKFDWKTVFADTSITGMFMALQIYFHNKGLM